MQLHDIRERQDVVRMVDGFYAKVNDDPTLSPIFNDFADVDWDTHLPKMYSFWNSIIFGDQTYSGRPLAPHLQLPIDDSHFEIWLRLFDENMNELFEGETAERVKERARFIASNFSRKIAYFNSIKTDG